MTHACPAAHLGLEMWENEGNAYHVYTCNSLSAANSFFFLIFIFSFCLSNIPTTIRRGSASYWIISFSHRRTHTYLYLYLETRADTVRRLLVLGFVFYKEYGSFVEKITWRRRIESKYM